MDELSCLCGCGKVLSEMSASAAGRTIKWWYLTSRTSGKKKLSDVIVRMSSSLIRAQR